MPVPRAILVLRSVSSYSIESYPQTVSSLIAACSSSDSNIRPCKRVERLSTQLFMQKRGQSRLEHTGVLSACVWAGSGGGAALGSAAFFPLLLCCACSAFAGSSSFAVFAAGWAELSACPYKQP